MKRIYRNYPLWCGAILFALVLLIAIYGPSWAPNDPMKIFNETIFEGEEIYIPSRSPVPPLVIKEFPLGSDHIGRDLLSRLLWGIRPTLLLTGIIVLCRLLVGVPLGLLGGWSVGRWSRLVDILIGVSLTVPILVFSLAIIVLIGERTLPVFVVALVATGWTDTAIFVRNRTLAISQADFIEGARAVGARPSRILFRHILPQLWNTFPQMITYELSAVMLLIAELGFLGTFIGGAFLTFTEDANSTGVSLSGLADSQPELAQMLANFWSKIFRSPWEMAIISLAIFLLIFIFNLLGEGFRRHFDITHRAS